MDIDPKSGMQDQEFLWSRCAHRRHPSMSSPPSCSRPSKKRTMALQRSSVSSQCSPHSACAPSPTATANATRLCRDTKAPLTFYPAGDQIKETRNQDPVASAKDALKNSLQKEDFRAAADALDKLATAVTERARGIKRAKINRLRASFSAKSC